MYRIKHVVLDEQPGQPAAGGASPSTPAPTPSQPKAAKKNKGFKAAPKAKKAAKVKPAPKKAKTTKARKATQGKGPSVLKTYGKQYARPKGVKTAAGNQVVDSGDKTAKELRGKTLEQVYARASQVLKESVPALKSKYKHLNDGMQRMNLGNRIRAAS